MKRSVDSESALVRSFGSLQSKTFDLAIVGGGAVGASIASYAASAGLSVALLEAADYASGGSAKSPSFLHGEKADLTLGALRKVREAGRERKRLRQVAPHLVEPRSVVVPLRYRMSKLRRQFARSLTRSPGQVGVDAQDCIESLEHLQVNEPHLRLANYPHTWSFDDYEVDGTRLIISMLRDAVSNGAGCANYVRVQSIEQRRDLYFLYCVDELSASEFAVRCRCVVDTAGHETERAENGKFLATGQAESEPARYLKRLQVAVPRECLPLHYPMQLETADHNTVSVTPRGQVTYVVATRALGHLSVEPKSEVTEDDIQYLLEPLAVYFSVEPIRSVDVVSCSAEFAAAAKAPDSKVLVAPNGAIVCDKALLDECGPIRDETIRLVEKVLKRAVIPTEPSRLLPGGDLRSPNSSSTNDFGVAPFTSEVRRIGALYSIDKPIALRLVRLYGCEVERVLGVQPDRLSSQVFAREVDWAVSAEGAITVEDVLYRRLQAIWYEPGELALLLPAVSERMADLLGWDANEQTRQRIMAEQRIALDLAAVPLAV